MFGTNKSTAEPPHIHNFHLLNICYMPDPKLRPCDRHQSQITDLTVYFYLVAEKLQTMFPRLP